VKARDRKTLGRYCRTVADRMELRDWHIDVMHEDPSDETAYASAECIYGQKRVRLRFCPEFRDLAPIVQRHVVVHELVHCRMAAVQSQAERDLEDHIGRLADSLFFRSFRRNLEYAVDALSVAIAKHTPLIDWPAQ
jgi:hypothetical protein